MRNRLISLICFVLIFTFSGVCYGEETYPLGILTREQIIEKYFSGRTLNPIEGIWEVRPGIERLIVKIETLDNKQKEKYAGWDYLMISMNDKKSDVFVTKLKITSSPFFFTIKESKDTTEYIQILSPMTILERYVGSFSRLDLFYTRSYPQVELKAVGN